MLVLLVAMDLEGDGNCDTSVSGAPLELFGRRVTLHNGKEFLRFVL